MNETDRSHRRAAALVAVVGLWASACTLEDPVSVDPQLAKGGAGPTVEAASPPAAPQDTTLDVTVVGTGFDDGSAVRFLLNGQSAPKLLTNASTYVDRNTMTVNVTVEADADVAAYDIEVTTRRGKKGVGTELFSVQEKKPHPHEEPPLIIEGIDVTLGYPVEPQYVDLTPIGDVWGGGRESGGLGETTRLNDVTLHLDYFVQRFGACFDESLFVVDVDVTSPEPGLGLVSTVLRGTERDGLTTEFYTLDMTGPMTGPWPGRVNEVTSIDLTDWELTGNSGGPKRDKCNDAGAFDNVPAFAIYPTPRYGPLDFVAPFMRKPFDGDYPATSFADHTQDDGQPITWWGEAWRGGDYWTSYGWEVPAGTPIRAVADGLVIASTYDQVTRQWCGAISDDHQFVWIEHTTPEGVKLVSRYGLVENRSVQVGQTVSAGDVIATAKGGWACNSMGFSFGVGVENPAFANPIARYSTKTDPYGWSGGGQDPLVDRLRGTTSHWLWLPDEAPELYFETSASTGDSAEDVWLTRFRLLGVDDSINPNNELVEVRANPALGVGATVDLTGYELRSTDHPAVYAFPSGFQLPVGTVLRVHSGSGVDDGTTLYRGEVAGVYPNATSAPTCVQLMDPMGGLAGELCR